MVRDKASTKSRIAEVQEFALNALRSISTEVIANFNKHIRDKEDWFWREEGLTRGLAERFIIQLDDDERGLWDSESDDEISEEEMEGEEIDDIEEIVICNTNSLD